MLPTKALKLLALVSVAVLVSAAPGCKKKAVTADASQPLQESFQAAEPEVKQAIDMANTSLKAGNYAEATKILAPVVEQRALTEPQKEAVGLAIQQILFATEMVGAVRSIDPETGYHFDDTKRYVDAIPWLGDAERRKIFEDNARRVYPRLNARLAHR